MWRYSQSSGELKRNDTLIATGYSGYAAGKNDPAAQEIHNYGPLPRGGYRIGQPEDTAKHGPYVLPLVPAAENEMFGRAGFLIHGDSREHPGCASEGCIIVDRHTRELIHESADDWLQVGV